MKRAKLDSDIKPVSEFRANAAQLIPGASRVEDRLVPIGGFEEPIEPA
jgi:hypothetical protein